MRFTIDKVVLEQVLNYLAMKPYNEVAQLIATIQQSVKVVEEPTASAANP